ncbi:pyridoxine 5'-phosphate oxidase C-terminal domain-containing protein [Streptomyces sp. NPDC057062]|uniref:pyridoxine 5'-phosphate oxidase C-terminal domain-containing protein n=1 Tax=Streptomyces sp. NPDC057062 TaxID=3346011 RepID=UPI003636AF84
MHGTLFAPHRLVRDATRGGASGERRPITMPRSCALDTSSQAGGPKPRTTGPASDLLARAPSARAEVLLGRQSEHLENLEDRDRAFNAALARIEAEPALVSQEWTLCTLVPAQIEFWQADKGRLHNRLRYERPDRHSAWERHLLWP